MISTRSDFGDAGLNSLTMVVTSVNGLTDSCMSNVTVLDNIMPVALCHDTVLTMDSTCFASVTPAELDNGSSDNCSPLSYSLSQSTFNCSHIGLNLVTFTVTDAAGNVSQCTSNITIIDVTGIQEISGSQQLDISPNPSSGILNLPLNALNGTFELIDLSGKVVFAHEKIENTSVDLSHLNSGCYMINLRKEGSVFRAMWSKY